jgi:Spy/CpxP family protein refolding chaperone
MVDATKPAPTESTRPRGAKRLLLGLLLAVTGTVAVSAWAQHGPGPHGPGPHGGGGFGGPGLFMGGPERTGRAVDHLLDGLNATDAQRTQVKQIAQAAAADLKAQHEASRGLHEQALALFAAPVVDARAVEALRVQTVAQHDQASKRITQAMLDVSAVLTPEQRAKLADRAKKRAEQMRERMGREQRDRPSR